MQIVARSLLLALAAAACTSSSSSSPSSPPSPNQEPADCAVATDALPATLSASGFFCSDVKGFTPAATLWSDGAEKERFIRLPPGTHIDATDMDAWSFPVGTLLWKEFVVDGQRIETRALLKTAEGDDASSWDFGAYVWRADGSDADLQKDGAVDATPSGWDVPAASSCLECHENLAGRFRVLGFSAVMLSHDDQLQKLVDESLLAPAPEKLHAPAHAWPQQKRDALLYLAINCGHCHQPGAQGFEYTRSDDVRGLDLHVSYADLLADEAGAATTTLDNGRVVPGDAAASLLFQRLSDRTDAPMPPLGTEHVDEAGRAAVQTWINGLNGL